MERSFAIAGVSGDSDGTREIEPVSCCKQLEEMDCRVGRGPGDDGSTGFPDHAAPQPHHAGTDFWADGETLGNRTSADAGGE